MLNFHFGYYFFLFQKILSIFKIPFGEYFLTQFFMSLVVKMAAIPGIEIYISVLSLCLNIFLIYQFIIARKTLTSGVFHKLHDDWKSEEVYNSMQYIHQLRREWKGIEQNPRNWDKLAHEWVDEHTGINPREDKILSEEMMKRRLASQVLSRTGIALQMGYISPDDFFGIVPEIGRILSVLIPLEIEIEKHWDGKEEPKLANWDRPITKWVFNDLFNRYIEWYQENRGKLRLDPIDWDSLG